MTTVVALLLLAAAAVHRPDVVLGLFVLGAVFIPLERRWPVRRQPVQFRRPMSGPRLALRHPSHARERVARVVRPTRAGASHSQRIPCPIGVALSGRSGLSRIGGGPWPSPTSTGSGRRAFVGRAGSRRSRVRNHACPAGLVVLLHGHDPISVGGDQSRGGGCTTRRRRAGSDPTGVDRGDTFARSRPPSGPTIGSAAHDQNRGPSIRVDGGRGRRGKCRSVSAPS